MRRLAAVLIFGAISATCSTEPASRPAADPSTLPSPPGIPGELFVSNEMSGDLSVIDTMTGRVAATIPVGKRPRGLQVSPDGATLYVALSGSPIAPPGVDEKTLPPPDRAADGIGVVDIRARQLRRVIRAGSDPEELAVSQDGRWLFVANEDAGQLSVVAIADGRVIATLPVGGEPEGVDLRPDGKVVYVTSENDNSVAVIDAIEPKLVATIAVGPRPRSTGFLPDSSRAYVSAENGSSLTVVDAIKHTAIETIHLPGQMVRPMGVVAASDGRMLFVSTGRGRSVVMIDPATNSQVAAVEVGDRPWGIAVSPDGSMVFTANGPSNDVSFVHVPTRNVIARVKVGDRPWGVAFVR